MEILSEEPKPIALENYEFENRQNMHIDWNFSHGQPVNNPIQGPQSMIVPSKKHVKLKYRNSELDRRSQICSLREG